MRCPICKTRLIKLMPGEYVCHNDNCDSNKRGYTAHAEFYGDTQKEIDKQKHCPYKLVQSKEKK